MAFIGRGSFGRVSKVWDKVNNKYYAMKEIHVNVSVSVTAALDEHLIIAFLHFRDREGLTTKKKYAMMSCFMKSVTIIFLYLHVGAIAE